MEKHMSCPRVSVIVPVYNKAQTLGRCLTSLCGQNFDDFEIILVDDGSADESLKVAKAFAERDGRIRIISQANAGAGKARNRGLSESRGAYVCFVDADDYVSSDYIRQMLREAVRLAADMVISNPILETGRETRTLYWYEDWQLAGDRAGCFDLALRERDGMQLIPPWGKLIRAELAKSARFPDMRFCEDAVYVLELLGKNPMLAAIPYAGYHYVRDEGSLTASVPVTDLERVVDAVVFNRKMYRAYRDVNEDICRNAANAYAKRVYIVLLALVRNGDEKRYHAARKHLSKDAKAVLREKGIEKKVWILLRLYLVNPKTCWKTLRLLLHEK